MDAIEKVTKSLSNFLSNTKEQRDAVAEIDTRMKSISEKLNITTTPSASLATNLDNAKTSAEGILAAFRDIEKIANKLATKEIIIPTGALPNQFGGLIPGTGNRDTVPAMLTPGEFVVNATSTRKFFSQLVAINRGIRPQGFQEGGIVNNVGDINVSVPQSVGVDGREIARAIKRELFRGSVRLR